MREEHLRSWRRFRRGASIALRLAPLQVSYSQGRLPGSSARTPPMIRTGVTAKHSSQAARSDLCLIMTGHTETGWRSSTAGRSSAVAEITCDSSVADTADCSPVAIVILRGLALSATGIARRSTPLL
jgi:hypothetical protein